MRKKILFFLIVPLIFVILSTFFGIVKIEGNSMNPNLENNDYVVLKKRNLKIQRFDIVVFKKNNKYFIKRVIGLPNEKIEYKGNVLSVDGSIISESYDVGITDDFCLEEKIPKGMYFVLGDNRKYSDDSRMYGYIKHDEIIGVVVFKLF